jgi:AraC-like DNA-binding protein
LATLARPRAAGFDTWHDDGVDYFGHTTRAAAPCLQPMARKYTAYAEHTQSFAARRELATTQGVLIFALEGDLKITGADGITITLRQGQAFAGGIATGTSISRALGPQRGVHIYLTLPALAALCETPIAQLANRVLPLDAMIGANATSLGEQLAAATPHRQFQLIDAFLQRRLYPPKPAERPIWWAMHRLAAQHAPEVAHLANDIGWSRKHLSARFTAITGFSPQTFRRLARFDRFAAAMRANPAQPLAQLAADAGYHDQPHLTRDVTEFSAMTPAELRRRLIPNAGGVKDH